jgi:hypothetical protein
VPADRLGRRFHAGQPPAVGADCHQPLAVELDQHSAQGIAAAFHVGGEFSPLDDLAKQAGRQDVVLLLVERGDRREFFRVLGRQLELAAGPLHDRPFAARFDEQFLVAAFAEDGAEVDDRQDRRALFFDLDPLEVDAHANLHVGRHERGHGLFHVQADVLQDRLGAAGGSKQRRGAERSRQLRAVTGDFHERAFP